MLKKGKINGRWILIEWSHCLSKLAWRRMRSRWPSRFKLGQFSIWHETGSWLSMQGKARGYPRLLNLWKLPETLKTFLPYLVLYSAQKHETFDWCWDNFDLIYCSRTKSWATVYAFNVISQQSLYCRCISEVSALRKIKRNIWRTVVINIRCQSSRVSVL